MHITLYPMTVISIGKAIKLIGKVIRDAGRCTDFVAAIQYPNTKLFGEL